MSALTMDKLVALCKGRGFIYPGSEIYGLSLIRILKRPSSEMVSST